MKRNNFARIFNVNDFSFTLNKKIKTIRANMTPQIMFNFNNGQIK